MEWTRAIDAYCERTDPGFWAEPVNAATNLAFILAALFMWPRSKGVGLAQLLCVVLFAIGVGSFLFHTFAVAWAGLSDVVPIVLFILIYLYAANRVFWGLSVPVSLGTTAGFMPVAVLGAILFSQVPFLRISAEYWPVPILILGYAWGLSARLSQVSRGLMLGGGLLILSLVFRSADGLVCPGFHLGTHFLWHILNGVMLAWMIEVLVRAHRSA